MAALGGLVSALESYRGRDRLMRTLSYGCQLIGGLLAKQSSVRSEVGKRLLVISAQLSHCRTVLRLFDDLAMLAYSRQYGLGAKLQGFGPVGSSDEFTRQLVTSICLVPFFLEEDVIVRCLSVINNLADQLYYPCEHVAWAADAKIIHINSTRWWTLSMALWGLSLLLGIGRSLKIILNLRRKLRNPERKSASKTSRREKKILETQVKSEILTLLSNLADLANAIHWLPPGFLWAGRFPPWLVGLMGTVSSLISVYQASGPHSEKSEDSGH